MACSVWLVDGGPLRPWFRPLEIFGLNAIAAYLISRLVTNLPPVHIMGKIAVLGWLVDRRSWYLKL